METRAPCNLYETTATGRRAAQRAMLHGLLCRCAPAELNYPRTRARHCKIGRDRAGDEDTENGMRKSLDLLSTRGRSISSPKRLTHLHTDNESLTIGRTFFTYHGEYAIYLPLS